MRGENRCLTVAGTQLSISCLNASVPTGYPFEIRALRPRIEKVPPKPGAERAVVDKPEFVLNVESSSARFVPVVRRIIERILEDKRLPVIGQLRLDLDPVDVHVVIRELGADLQGAFFMILRCNVGFQGPLRLRFICPPEPRSLRDILQEKIVIVEVGRVEVIFIIGAETGIERIPRHIDIVECFIREKMRHAE